MTLFASPAAAAGEPRVIVGDGTAGSCTELALHNGVSAAAINGGGTITFKCGNSPVTITLTTAERNDPQTGPVLLVVPDNTNIDGAGLITLDGAYFGTVVLVERGNTVSLKGLCVARGFYQGGVFNAGALTVRNSSFSGNFSGGIRNTGTLTVTNSTFSGNGSSSSFYGGIRNEGGVTVDRSDFRNNTAWAGGGILNIGTLSVKNSTFSGNSADLPGGGGINNLGALSIDNSTFSHNIGYTGGGVMNWGSLVIKNSTFSSNSSPGPGGGGILHAAGTLTVQNSEFFDNSGYWGGGIYNGDTLIIENSRISGNRAVYGGGIFNAGALNTSNSFVAKNIASLDGGGIYVLSPALPITNKHLTVVDNTPNDIGPQP